MKALPLDGGVGLVDLVVAGGGGLGEGGRRSEQGEGGEASENPAHQVSPFINERAGPRVGKVGRGRGRVQWAIAVAAGGLPAPDAKLIFLAVRPWRVLATDHAGR